MNKFVSSTVIVLVGGGLWAQTQQVEPRKPDTTTWTGTLVDTGCRSPRSERQTAASNSSSYSSTTSTTSFALITADGKCIPFDVGSNEKVDGMFKIKTDWSENTVKIKPTKVDVVGTERNGQISVDEIQVR